MGFGMDSSPTGMTAGRAASTGSNVRGVSPGMKHIPGHHRFQQFTPEQMELFQQMLGMVGPQSFLSRLMGGDEEIFRQIEAPAQRQFAETLGGIGSRFSFGGGDRGAMSSRHSSGFQNAVTSAGSNFAQDLAAQRMGLQRQATLDIAEIAKMLMGQEPFGLAQKGPKEPSFMDRWFDLAARTMGAAGKAQGGF